MSESTKKIDLPDTIRIVVRVSDGRIVEHRSNHPVEVELFDDIDAEDDPDVSWESVTEGLDFQ